MATYYSQSSGVWSSLTRWDTVAGGGGSDPASVAAMEDNLFVIQAGHVIDFDIDTSAWTTGFQTITITGDNANPGTLRCDSTTLAAGTYNVKMKTGYSIVGSSGAVTYHGRILVNSDGNWDTTTALANDRKFIISTLTGTSTAATMNATHLDIKLFCTQPTISYVEVYGVPFVVTFTNATEKFTIISPTNTPAIPPNGTPVTLTGTLPAELTEGTTYYVKAVSGATGELEASIGGGTIALSDDGSGTIYMHYGCWGPVTQSTNVNTTTGVITWNGVPPAADTPVRVKSSGILPIGLLAYDLYYIRTVSGNTCKLSLIPGSDTGIVIPTAVGTGNISMYCGSSYTNSKVVNIIQDVTTDWVATAGGNGDNIVLANYGPAAYDQQRDVLATITAKIMVLTTNNVNSAQYPLARIYLTARNVAFRSASTGNQPSITNAVGCTFQCEISKTVASGTTFYGSGLNNSCNSNTVSGIITGCNYAIYSTCNGNTISGTIIGCSSGMYSACNTNTIAASGAIVGCSYGINTSCSNNSILGTIIGCSAGFITLCNGNTISGGIYGCLAALNTSCTKNTISGTISGCSYVLTTTCCGNTISGMITGCSNAIKESSNGNIVTGIISGCSYTLISSSSNNLISGMITGTVSICTPSLYSVNTLINVGGIASSPTFGDRNTTGIIMRLASENHGRVEGAMKIFEEFGDIVKTACDGTGAAPTQDPDGGTGNCIEVSNLQSNLSVYDPLPIFTSHRIWMEIGTHTVTYKVQTNFVSGITAGNLKLMARYITTDGASAEVTHAPSISVRTGTTDWTQTLAVTFVCARAGWADLRMDFYQYESGKVLYVWPTPVIS